MPATSPALAATVLLLAAAGELIAAVPSRVRGWRCSAFWLGQFGAAVVIAVAFSELGQSAAAGIVAGVIGFEAVAATPQSSCGCA